MTINKSANSFKKIEEKFIPSLNLTLQEFEHEKTGAKHYHLNPKNSFTKENVFMVVFKTMPQDDTGVAHILEHTVLCGSKKFPIRNPFFNMTKRSLQTFMNAMTGQDYTAYPFASENKKDFNNLLEVYLDATFFSKIDKQDFLQEGWRLEYEESTNLNSPLQFKGVVFNEMKGALDSPVSEVYNDMSKHFYKSTTYEHNFGGDPVKITDLTYEKLKDFYEIFYHPSNAIFFTYGDISVNEHQEKFEQFVLKDFSKIDIEEKLKNMGYHDSKTFDYKNFLNVKVNSEYALAEVKEEGVNHVLATWVLSNQKNIKESIKNQILQNALIENSSSPLMQVLENCKIGVPSPILGIDTKGAEMMFICGLDNVANKNVDKVIPLIEDTLIKIKKEGIPIKILESIISNYELHFKEIKGGNQPYGLELMLNMTPMILNDINIYSALDYENIFAEIREEMKEPNFISDLIDKNFINNKMKMVYNGKANANLADLRKEREKEKLKKINNSLSIKEKMTLLSNSKLLKERQDEIPNVDILPKVTVSDIDVEFKTVLSKKKENSYGDTYLFDQATNGISYMKILVDIPKLTKKELELFPIYKGLFFELGVDNKNYLETQIWQSEKVSGLNTSILARDNESTFEMESKFILSGKSLNKDKEDLCHVLLDTFKEIKFDEIERIQDLLDKSWQATGNSLANKGSGYSTIMANASLSEVSCLSNHFGGINSFNNLKAIVNTKIDYKEMSKILKTIHMKMLNSKKVYSLISDNSNLEELELILDKKIINNSFWEKKENKDFLKDSFSFNKLIKTEKKAIITKTQVNFITMSFPGTSNKEDMAKLQVLSNFLKNGYLHSSIREKGGAYDAGCSVQNDIISFTSYRDPRLLGTVEDFKKSVDWLLNKEHSKEQLDEAIINSFQQISSNTTPIGEANSELIRILFDSNAEKRVKYRQNLLNTTINDLKEMAKKYLLNKNYSLCIFTDKENKDTLENEGFNIMELTSQIDEKLKVKM